MSKGYEGVKFHPRLYQKEALRGIWDAWKGGIIKRVLAVMPTGSGKTILFSMLCNHVVKNLDGKVLILAHRDELIRQAQDKLFKSTGLDSAIEKASETGVGSFHNVVVASVQTLTRSNRLNQYASDYFDYIIVDEAHHVLAKTYLVILNYFKSAKVLGVTATPARGDKQGLGKFFEVIAYEYRLGQARKDGWLTPVKVHTCPLNIDISKCRIVADKFNLSDLDGAIAPYLDAIADEIWRRAPEGKILLFLPLVKTSKAMASIMSERGFDCRHIDGKMSDQDKIDVIEWFRSAPKGSALCNCDKLVEGFDQDDITHLAILTADVSRSRYCQKMGRVMRVLDPAINNPELNAEQRRAIIAASDKPYAHVFDFLWNSAKHRLCTPASLVGETEKIVDAMNKIQKASGREITLDDLEEKAHEQIQHDRETKLAEMLEASKGRKAVTFDPVMQALSVFNDDLNDWEPEMAWESEPISDRQLEYLRDRCKFDCEGWSKGYAAAMLDAVSKRSEQGLCSIPQLNCLQKNGFPNAHKFSKEEAGIEMDRLSAKWDKAKKWRNKR